MANEKAPAFQCYARDSITDTSACTLAETGVYFKLRCWTWLNGPVPLERLHLILGVPQAQARKLWAAVAPFWHETSEGWVAPDLETQRKSLDVFLKSQRAKAPKGASKRWAAGDVVKGSRSERLARAREAGTHTYADFQAMVDAYDGACLKCGLVTPLVQDHVIPIYRGGNDLITNIQPLCRPCNSGKGSDTTDYRVSHPATLPEWLPKSVTPLLAECLPGDSPTPASALCTLHSADQTQDHKNQPPSGPVLVENPVENDNPRVLLKLAHTVLDEQMAGAFAAEDLETVFERRAARAGLNYAGDRTRKALESAQVQRANGRRAR